MRKFRFKKFGPFSYFRVHKERKHFISAWPTGHDNAAYGWEWGTDDNPVNPSYCLRIGHFNVFSYEPFDEGFTIFVLGFWWTK